MNSELKLKQSSVIYYYHRFSLTPLHAIEAMHARANPIFRVELYRCSTIPVIIRARGTNLEPLTGRDGLRLLEDDASSSKGAVIRDRMCERETHHYARVYREHSPILAACQSLQVMHLESQGQTDCLIEVCVWNAFRFMPCSFLSLLSPTSP